MTKINTAPENVTELSTDDLASVQGGLLVLPRPDVPWVPRPVPFPPLPGPLPRPLPFPLPGPFPFPKVPKPRFWDLRDPVLL